MYFKKIIKLLKDSVAEMENLADDLLWVRDLVEIISCVIKDLNLSIEFNAY